MINPEALSATMPSRLDLAREQLRDTSLTPGERETARRIVFSDLNHEALGGDCFEGDE